MTSFKSSRRFFLQLCSGLGFTLTISACQFAPDTAQPAPLKVGVNIGFSPWRFEDESGELVGFEVDMVEAIAQSIGQEVEFVDVPFIELFPAVASGRIDVAASAIAINEERLETVDFSQPYYDSDQSLTVRIDGDISGLEDFDGKRVATDAGTTSEAWIERNLDRYKFGEIVRYEGSFEVAMQDLAAGVVDGYITNTPSALYYTQRVPGLAVIERSSTSEQYGLMFAKENPLRDEFNAAITHLKKNGSLAEIHEKWFGEVPNPDTSTVVVEPLPAL